MSLAGVPGPQVVETALGAVLAAGAVATAVLLVAARPWRGRAARAGAFGPPLALAGAFATGYVMVLGAPGIPPSSARGWLFLAAVAAGLLGLARVLAARPLRPLAALACALLPWCLLGFQREHHWSSAEGIVWTAGLAAWTVLCVEALHTSEARSKSPSSSFGLAFGLALAAGAYGIAGSASFAQLGGVLAVAVGLCALVGAWHRDAGLGSAAAPALVLLHLGLLWCSRYLAELHGPSFVLLSLLPVAPFPVSLLPDARARLRVALAVALPVALAAAALWIEVAAAPPPSPYG